LSTVGSIGSNIGNVLSKVNTQSDVKIDVNVSDIFNVHGKVASTTVSDVMAFGKLLIHVHDGKEIPAMDYSGTSDCFVKITIGTAKVESKIIKKSLTPNWDEKIECDIPTQSDNTAIIELFDWDNLSAHDLIGRVEMSLNKLQPGKNDITLQFPLMKKKLPTVRFVFQVQPKLVVMVVEGKDLIVMDENGKSDPYVECMIRGQRFKTTVRKASLNPVWNEGGEFSFSQMSSVLVVSCWDWDTSVKKESMGTAVLPMTSLKAGKNDIWLKLPKGGALHLLIDAYGVGETEEELNVKQGPGVQHFNVQKTIQQLQLNQMVMQKYDPNVGVAMWQPVNAHLQGPQQDVRN
jgi:Ca2+-dependent lipid-binding protein